MSKHWICIMCLLSFCQASTAQIKSKEELDLGNQLRKTYPDDEVCAVSSVESYSFLLGRNDSISATKTLEEKFVGLKDNSAVVVVESYNHFSDIISFRTFIKRGSSYSAGTAVVTDRAYFQSDVFDDDNRYKSAKLIFPTLGSGAACELDKSYRDVRYLSTIFFHDRYPVEEKTIKITLPDWMKADVHEFNFDGFEVKKTKERDEKLKATTYQYTLTHCVALKEEDDAPSTSFSWPHLVIVTKSYTNKSGKQVTLFNSVDDLYSWYSYLVSKTPDQTGFLRKKVEELVAGKTTDTDKIKAIYYWVQDNIRYIAFERGLAGFVPESAEKVYTTKYGDCKGMANLMTNMLKMAGFDARLAWIGTRDIPYDYSLPSMVVDNHMICALMLKDSIYFLDGTESFISFGDYAYRIQGRPALIQDGKKYLIKSVPDLPKERNKTQMNISMTLDGETLKGKSMNVFNGESQTDLLRYYSTTKSDQKEDLLNYLANRGDKNYAISNLKTSDLTDRENPLQLEYDFDMQNKVTRAGNETYVSIDFSNDFADKLPDEKRQNDYEFSEKIYRIYQTEFLVPSGYQVKYLPESLSVNQPDYKFNVSYQQQDNKIIMNKTLSIDNGVIRKSIFEQWKKDLRQLKAISAEQVVLEKK